MKEKIEIKTFIGRKLNYIDGIYRRQIELDRPLRNREDIKLSYNYYTAPRNPIDFLTKRFVLFPYYSWKEQKINSNCIFHITYQNIADLALFLDSNRTIATVHDIFYFLERDKIRNPVIVQKYSLLGLKKCRFIVSISDFTKEQLITRLNVPPEKIVVIKNGMNQEMFKQIPENKMSEVEPLYPEFQKILHVGTEVYRKNFITLLKCLYLLKKKNQKIKLIRVGPPDHQNIIYKLGLAKDIIYLSNISNERLMEVYNLCDFFVFPSLYEGWGAPGLEAASCGTPVICSDIPIFREVYKNFPFYFPSLDYKLLANLIGENINNDNLKKEMSIRGKRIVKEYNWSESSQKYLKLAKYIINND